MKKNLIIILITLLLPTFVYAGGNSDDGVAGATMIRSTCIYRNTSNFREHGQLKTTYSYSEFDFSGIGYVAGGPTIGIKTYYNEDLGNNVETFSTDFDGMNYVINFNKDFGVKFTIDAFMSNQFQDYDTNEDTLQDAIDSGKFCPSTVYRVYKDDEPEFMFCNGYNSDLGVETCDLVKQYLDTNYSGYTIARQELYVEEAFSNNGQEDMTQTDVNDKYVEVETEKEDVCDENSAAYDLEKCKILQGLSDTIVDQAGDQGITEENLNDYFNNYKKEEYNPESLDCNSLLGNPKTQGQPAFYLQIVFDVMKYVAIIIVIVFSILDFTGAVASQDNDILKKSTKKLLIRLILCVAIFVLPTILEFIFTLINVYSPSTCGIN